MTYFEDARDAVRDATLIASAVSKPRAIGYVQGRGWRVYDPTQGAPPGAVPEFLVLPVESGSSAYLEWLFGSLAGAK